MLRTVVGAGQIIYLSGPITGGRRFVDWHRDVGSRIGDGDAYRDARRHAVFLPNCHEMQELAEGLRTKDRIILAPAAFEAGPSNWSQDQYLALWERVISHHASAVVLMSDWWLSAGCALECRVAYSRGIEVLTATGETFDRRAAADALARGVETCSGDPHPRMVALRASLERELAALAQLPRVA